MAKAVLLCACLMVAAAPSVTLEVAEAQSLGYAQRPLKVGHAKYYRPGLMQRVARNRGMTLRKDVAGYAAVTDCGAIGKIAVASIKGGPPQRFQILDCSHPRDRARHLRQGLVIEVNWEVARRYGFTRQGRASAVLWSITN
jgi:hypothetical protein